MSRAGGRRRASRRRATPVQRLVAGADQTLLDLVDHVLNKGLMLHGDLVLSLADVDLVYVRLSALLCAADKVLPARRRR